MDFRWRRLGIDPARFVFVDETFATTAMTRLYGWGPKSLRVVGKVPHSHRKTMTFVDAFRCGGLCAPMVVDGPVNGDVFREYVRQVLAPCLKPGDVLVMDNLAAHKVAGVAEAVAATAAA